MIKRSLHAFFSEVRSYSYSERIFILFIMLCSICITADYAITRPISYSVFVFHFSTAYLPYAWLVMLPINFCIVMLYNRLISHWGCLNTALFWCSLTIAINALSSVFLNTSPVLSFAHFIWKDIYVLLMFQQVWSVVNSTINFKRAKYLYGVIFGVGGVGSICGSFVPAFFATKVGSETLLLSTVVIYGSFMLFYKLALAAREKIDLSPITLPSHDTSKGFNLIHKSKHLQFILLIVVFMQLSTTFIDFQFHTYLSGIIPDKDLRTAFCGKLFSFIHVINLFLHFFGTFLTLQLLGLKRSHLFIPIFFGCTILGFVCAPIFSLITLCFSSIKAFDYSIFNIIKEMLYLPLKTEEKFKAKAIIDVFAHRSSRAIGSLMILLLQFLHLTTYLSWVLLFVSVLWIFAVINMFKAQELKSY